MGVYTRQYRIAVFSSTDCTEIGKNNTPRLDFAGMSVHVEQIRAGCTECLGRIVEWIVGGQTPRAWKVISLR